MTRTNEQQANCAIDVDALITKMRAEMETGAQVRPARVDGRLLLSRVRAEVVRRSLQAATASDSDTRCAIEWTPTHPRIPPQREYVLGDLTAFDDEDFVTNAYLAVLRRPPDPEGFAGTLHALREGRSKVELLGNLRWSPEGLSRGVHIDGLLLPYTLQRWEQKRFLGAPVAWLHGLVKLGVSGRRQRIAEARQARETHELGRLLNRLASLEAQTRNDGRREVRQLALDVQRGQGQLSGRLGATTEQFTQNIAYLKDQLEGDLHRLSGDVADIRRELAEAKEALSLVRGALDSAHARLAQLGELESEWRSREASTRSAERFMRSLDPLYADFEDAFRGSKDMIRQRAEPYLEWVREGGDITADTPVLDIGCGRGEWMELARDHGLQVRGIDLNHSFVEACRKIDLDVAEGDAIEVLRTLPEGSVGAVTSMHLVEHLPFEVLVQLIDEVLRVLRPGGVIALETPNPENLSVSSHWFFLDPTHRNPIPPVTLAWLVRQRGFVDPRIERLTVARDLDAPPLLSPELPGATAMNAVLERLHAATDYAIVARKPNA